MSGIRLVLASASPARLALLQQAGVDPEVRVSRIDEDSLGRQWTEPRDIALGLARAKAADVSAALGGERALVIGCDSVLEMTQVPELAGRALGKPRDGDEARHRWRLMRGNDGLLHTGHCLLDLPSGTERCALATTSVRFATPTDAEIDAYIATGEPLAVAGGFTIDGLGGAFVRGVKGDPSNVVGLSLPVLRDLVTQAGVFWPSFWGR